MDATPDQPKPGVWSTFEANGCLIAAGHQGHGNVFLVAEVNQIFSGGHRFSLWKKLFHNRLLNRQQSFGADRFRQPAIHSFCTVLPAASSQLQQVVIAQVSAEM